MKQLCAIIALLLLAGCSSLNLPKELIERNWALNLTAGGKPALGVSWQSSIATQDDATTPDTTADAPALPDSGTTPSADPSADPGPQIIMPEEG